MLRRRRPTPVNITDVDIQTLPVGAPIRVTWIDARHVATSWTPLQVAVSSPACEVTSVGVYVGKTDLELFYTADLVTYSEQQANGVSAIPRGCIHQIDQLGEPIGVSDAAD